MKDITDFLDPDLVFSHHGKEYVVPPPSKDDGLLLAALSVAGASVMDEAMGRGDGQDPTNKLTPKQRKLVNAAKDRDLGEISLGPAYKQMVKDKLPGRHIDQYAIYAMYYWIMGEQVADALTGAWGEAVGPKDQKPSKSGPS